MSTVIRPPDRQWYTSNPPGRSTDWSFESNDILSRGMRLTIEEFNHFYDALHRRCEEAGLIGKKFFQLHERSERDAQLAVMAVELRPQSFDNFDHPEWLAIALVVMLKKFSKGSSFWLPSSFPPGVPLPREAFEINSITGCIMRLHRPEHLFRARLSAFCSVKSTVPGTRANGLDLDFGRWYKSQAIDCASFDEATEELVTWDNMAGVIRELEKLSFLAVVNYALQSRQRNIPFLIRPQGSTGGEGELCSSAFLPEVAPRRAREERTILIHPHWRILQARPATQSTSSHRGPVEAAPNPPAPLNTSPLQLPSSAILAVEMDSPRAGAPNMTVGAYASPKPPVLVGEQSSSLPRSSPSVSTVQSQLSHNGSPPSISTGQPPHSPTVSTDSSNLAPSSIDAIQSPSSTLLYTGSADARGPSGFPVPVRKRLPSVPRPSSPTTPTTPPTKKHKQLPHSTGGTVSGRTGVSMRDPIDIDDGGQDGQPALPSTRSSSVNGGNSSIPTTPAPVQAEEVDVELDIEKLMMGLEAGHLGSDRKEDGESEAEYQDRMALQATQMAQVQGLRLGARLESKVCEQLSDETWRETCQFLRHPEHVKESAFVVKIPGMRRKLLPCQAHAVVRTLMMHHNGIGSCFHGHGMGVGKTTICLAAQLLQHIVNLMRWDIEKNPHAHLDLDQAPGATCPSNESVRKRLFLDCPCAIASPTHEVRSSLGACLILVPIALLENWRMEFLACFGGSNPFGMALVVAHSGSAKVADNTTLDVDKMARLQCHKQYIDGDTRPRCSGRVENGQVFCLSTSHSVESQLVAKFEQTVVRYVDIPPARRAGQIVPQKHRRRQETVHWNTLVLASLWRDEAHLEHLETSRTVQFLSTSWFDQQRSRGVHLNIMSGTLLTTGPLDIAYYIKAMYRTTWARHPELRRWPPNRCITLGEQWKKLLKGVMKGGHIPRGETRHYIDQLKPLIEVLVLRFTPDSEFLGAGKIIRLPKLSYSEQGCAHSPDWNRRLAEHKAAEDAEFQQKELRHRWEWERRGYHGTYVPLVSDGVTFHYRARLFASFPALLDVANRQPELRFTQDEWRDQTKCGNWTEETEPGFKNLAAIAASSAKLTRIRELIRQYKQTLDGEGLPTRLIFCSYFFQGARIIHLYMKHILKIPDSEIVFLHKMKSTHEINTALSLFHGYGQKNQVRPRYIVATTASFGVGLTLSEATVICLLEPDYNVATELQTFSRHHRLGTKNKISIAILLYAKGNEREQSIRDRNRFRKQLDKTFQGTVGQVDLEMIDPSIDSKV